MAKAETSSTLPSLSVISTPALTSNFVDATSSLTDHVTPKPSGRHPSTPTTTQASWLSILKMRKSMVGIGGSLPRQVNVQVVEGTIPRLSQRSKHHPEVL
jgi:hypothetical protein